MSNDDYEMMVAFCQLSEREQEQEEEKQEEVDASDGTPIEEEDADGGPPIIAWNMMMMLDKNEMTPSQFSSRASNIEMFLVFLCCEITIY